MVDKNRSYEKVSSTDRLKKFLFATVIAVNLGLLESAWTTPTAPGAVKAGLGCFAIGTILVMVCYPYVWWVPGLSMLEEFIQALVGNEGSWLPNLDWIFAHWSAGYFSLNLYPVISFPLVSILVEIFYLLSKRIKNSNILLFIVILIICDFVS